MGGLPAMLSDQQQQALLQQGARKYSIFLPFGKDVIEIILIVLNSYLFLF